ncbi:MAG TPA: class II glutamine amidotransferase [Solirubrobacteraceae bacterium]|nr:class II glutamine amidotransferase [Solirubrobacteraceae bacterium]
MCRLFGLSGGEQPVKATFWLLEAPDSLGRQSRREPDGTGVGTFDADGEPVVAKQALAAYEDHAFGEEARELSSRTFVAHVRYASNGGLTEANTHPFCQDGRLFAHNGVIGDLPALEAELGDAMRHVHGDTDSERFFALITREIERANGDVGAGIAGAARWVAGNLPVLSINCIVTTADGLWALRYPDTHELHVLERGPGGPGGHRHLEHASARGSIRVRSGDLSTKPAVAIATEPMDEDSGWRMLGSGELLHVGPDLKLDRVRVIDGPPRHPLSLEDLDPRAQASQRAAS